VALQIIFWLLIFVSLNFCE